MSISSRYPESKFSPMPEGLHVATCCDVIDLGEVDGPYGRQFKVRFTFQIEDVDPGTGRRYDAIATYHNTLHKKSNLRAMLEQWRGRKYSEDEAKAGIDYEQCLGQGALIQVTHNEAADGRIFANLDAVLPLPKGTPKITPLGYTRHVDRNRMSAGSPRSTTWPTKPILKPTLPDAFDAPVDFSTVPPVVETPMPPAADGDDIAFAFGANTGEVQS
jgi:hypothetical protein